MSTILLSLSFTLISLALTMNYGMFVGDYTPIWLLSGAFALTFILWLELPMLITHILQQTVGDTSITRAAGEIFEDRMVERGSMTGMEGRKCLPKRLAERENFTCKRITVLTWVTRDRSHIVLLFLFLLSFFLSLSTTRGMWAYRKEYVDIIASLSSYAFFIISLFWLGVFKFIRFQFPIFVLTILFALLLRLLTLSSSPYPSIDVFIILREAPYKLLQGINPYQTMYTHVFPGITPNYYAYWPGSFLLHLPLVVLLKDPRILHVLADIGAAILLFLIGGKTVTSQVIAVTYLLRPLSLFMIEASWLTPLNFFFTALVIYLIQLKKHALSGLALGLLTSVQFFHGMFFMFLIKLVRFSKSFCIFFLIPLIVLVLPFFLFAPKAFYEQTLWVYFKNPPHPSILIHSSLSLNTWFYYRFGKDIPSFIPLLILAFILLISFIRKNQTLGRVVGNITIFFFAAFLFGKQAFVNYYYFVGSLILLWIAVKEREPIDGKKIRKQVSV